MFVSHRVQLVSAACCAAALLLGACTKNSTPAAPSTTTPATPTCSYTVVPPTTTAYGPEGGTGTASVTAASGCSWTATSSGSFVTIAQGASGSGNGTVQFSVAVNTGADRTATLTIAGAVISITQRTQPAPTLSAPSAKSPVGGQTVDPGRPTLVVNNATSTGIIGPVTYRFEASTSSLFPPDQGTIAEEGVPQGTGGTTNWVPPQNLIPNRLWYWHASATSGAVTGAYSAVETFFTAQPQPCSYVLSPTSAALSGIDGATSTFTVTADNRCAWTAVSSDPFITILSGASGTGNGTVTFAVTANTGGTPRTGTIVVSGADGRATFAVTQDAGCVYNPSPNFVTFTNAGFVGQTFVVTTSNPACGWSVDVDTSWLVITAGSPNTGQATVTYSVLLNATGVQRVGNFIITGLKGGTSSNLVVTQQP